MPLNLNTTEIVSTADDDVAVVVAVEVDDGLSTFHPPGIARNRYHVLEDDILGQ